MTYLELLSAKRNYHYRAWLAARYTQDAAWHNSRFWWYARRVDYLLSTSQPTAGSSSARLTSASRPRLAMRAA
jgi:hypothetical protein